jgi:uncharacterized protein (DUF302 family)
MWFLEKETSREPDDVAERIREEAPKHGLRVLHVHDVQATLADKGFEMIPYRIVEVCGAKFAKAALDADRRLGLMMPCRITVYREQGVTKLATAKPTELMRSFPDVDLSELAREVEANLDRVMSAAT